MRQLEIWRLQNREYESSAKCTRVKILRQLRHFQTKCVRWKVQKCDRYTRYSFKTPIIVTILRQSRSNASVTSVTVIILRQIEIRFFSTWRQNVVPSERKFTISSILSKYLFQGQVCLTKAINSTLNFLYCVIFGVDQQA